MPAGPGTPYDVSAPDGTRYVSFADWICPTHCIEPAICPVIRAPRSWEMADAMDSLARRLDRSPPTGGPVLFVCEHRVFGVGMFDVAAVLAGMPRWRPPGSRESPVDVLVGTVSSCHGRGQPAAPGLRAMPPERAGTLGRSIFWERQTGSRSAHWRGYDPERRAGCHHRGRRDRPGSAPRCTPAGGCCGRSSWSAGFPAASCSTPSGSTTIPGSSTSSAASSPI